MSEYEFQLGVHQQEFEDYVSQQAKNVLRCADGCVDICLNQEWVEFHEVPKCLKWCDCGQNVIDVTETSSSYNYPELVEYAEGDQQAWSFFQLIKNKL